MSYPYDLFFSYARKDNLPRNSGGPVGECGWISAFHRELDRATRDHGAPGDHKIFFDTKEIKSGQDWELRIKAGLRDSCLMLAFVSPNYLSSEWCRKEWEFYIAHESARRVEGEGVHPIYFIEVPGLDSSSDIVDQWIADLRRRQRVDFRPWYDEGVAAFRHMEVWRQIGELEHRLHEIQRRMRAAADNIGTAQRARSSRFVGRKRELKELSHLLTSGTFGVLTAVHGWPGVGKTALAAEYAHSHAAKYSGGTWLLRCSGKDKLVLALDDLLTDLPITFTEAEQKDPERKVRRVFLELERRIVPTKEDPHPACLLIFDNVDKPELLSAAAMAQLPPQPWLHLLVTTRLGPYDLPGIGRERFLAVDEMEEQDALDLIERLQRGGRFASEDEREAARWIVHAVRRLALEVEGVAVYIGADPDVTCREFQRRLAAKGLDEAEDAGEQAGGQMLHRAKRLSVVFGELFATLTEEERYVSDCAALLPPDYVALPWLEELARRRFPEWQGWKKTVRRLLGRRLLTPGDIREWDGSEPLVS